MCSTYVKCMDMWICAGYGRCMCTRVHAMVCEAVYFWNVPVCAYFCLVNALSSLDDCTSEFPSWDNAIVSAWAAWNVLFPQLLSQPSSSTGNLGVNGECEMTFHAPELKRSSITAPCSISRLDIKKTYSNRIEVSATMLGLCDLF